MRCKNGPGTFIPIPSDRRLNTYLIGGKKCSFADHKPEIHLRKMAGELDVG
jgi:hypothetical protein